MFRPYTWSSSGPYVHVLVSEVFLPSICSIGNEILLSFMTLLFLKSWLKYDLLFFLKLFKNFKFFVCYIVFVMLHLLEVLC